MQYYGMDIQYENMAISNIEKLRANFSEVKLTIIFSQLSDRQMVLLVDHRMQHCCGQRIEPNNLFQNWVPALYK